jgi:hypothetical protein
LSKKGEIPIIRNKNFKVLDDLHQKYEKIGDSVENSKVIKFLQMSLILKVSLVEIEILK